LAKEATAKWRASTDHKRVSPSASEPGSASLHTTGVANLPDMMKPDICREETGVSTCRTPRGDRGERARKDAPRNPGDPLQPGKFTKERPGINNRKVCCMRESERPIVARKFWKQDGAKGPCCEHAESDKEQAAWINIPLRNNWRFGNRLTCGGVPT
jgi:hypothetical protein